MSPGVSSLLLIRKPLARNLDPQQNTAVYQGIAVIQLSTAVLYRYE